MASVSVAVLFADIARSTHLYEVLGDKKAKTLISDCLSTLSNAASRFQGSVIKTIGDEILCTFPDADKAVSAGKAMHEAIDLIPINDGIPANIYVGIHFGPVIMENDDIFGDTVNLAARMVAMAKQRQIITTEQTVELLNNELMHTVKYIDKITVKGKSGETKIYEVVWEEQEATSIFRATSISLFPSKDATVNLILQYHDTIVTVDRNRPVVTLGRQIHNDIIVDDSPVSRSHARIEYRRGKFFLVDQSTNGTYIHEEGKERVRVRQTEMPLTGKGIISLGTKLGSDSSFAIFYEYQN